MLCVTNIDVVLVNPPTEAEPANQFQEVGEPLGLCYLASELRRRGFAVFILDAFTLDLSAVQAATIVAKARPRLAVGLSILETSLSGSRALLRELRALGHEGVVVGGNYFASLNPTECLGLMPELDAIICGEGEIVFADLVQTLSESGDARSQPGSVWRSSKGGVIDNGIAPQPDLDELADPVRDCLPAVLDAGGTANVISGRGCYANCSFCSIAAFFTPSPTARRFRLRAAESVAREMLDVQRSFGVRRFLLPDDNFMPPRRDQPQRIDQFCRSLDKAEAHIEFTITCRANDIERDQIRRLKQAGLVGVYLGVESFLPRRLKLFRKGMHPETNSVALDILASEGVYAKIGFIMFDPYSTLDEIEEEVGLLRRMMEDRRTVHTAIDNILRHSTYSLELQAGTCLTRTLAENGIAFRTVKGWEYRHTDPRVEALRIMASLLLRFEGRSIAILRRLYTRLAYSQYANSKCMMECTDLWRRLGNCHFDVYQTLLAACRAPDLRFEELAQAINTADLRLKDIDDIAQKLLERSGGDTSPAIAWLRYVALPANRKSGKSDVFDPVGGCWLALDAPTLAVLQSWIRCSRSEIAERVAQDFGQEVAVGAIAKAQDLIEQGHFLTSRVAFLERDIAAFRFGCAQALAEMTEVPGIAGRRRRQ